MRRSGAHIFLAVPTRGAIRWETVTRLAQERDDTPGLRPILYQPGNLSVALTRNLIVRAFLATDCETLVMVDDDVVPPLRFLETLDRELDGYGMVAIPHVMPVTGGELVATAYREKGDGLVVYPLDEGLNEVDAVATGCCAISRAALLEAQQDPFRVAHDPTARITSDDFLFCETLLALGWKVAAWWQPWFCDHVTTVSLAPLYETQQRRLTAERSH